MKKLLVFALFLSATAHAGGMNEIAMMADESIFTELNLIGGLEDQMQIISRDFVKADIARDLAVQTQVIVQHVPALYKQDWTCVTQFVKTLKFYEVSETVCK